MKARFIVLAPVLVAASGCARAGGIGPWKGASVVLVSIVTLRADRLPFYGYRAGSTPNLDRIAAEGVVFEDAYSHCPLTLPAHASLLTGLLPPHHGVRDNLGFTLASPRTLAARFKTAGYRTGGSVSAFVLRKETGIAEGFDLWDDRIEAGSSPLVAQRDGAVAVEAVGRFIETEPGTPFFAFLHLYEPHAPYAPPERHRRADAYDGEVSYADELVGRLIDRLRAGKALDRAILVVTADHGEGLLDHGEQEHGVFLYRETVRIPLVVRLPDGARGGTRIRGPVAQVDTAATLLDLAGIPADGMDGVSLRDAIQSGKGPVRPVYSETFYPRFHFGWSELFAASDARFRYVRAPHAELFDVVADPKERANEIEKRRPQAEAMDAWIRTQADTSAPPVPAEVAPEARERLEALGYVGLGAGRARERMKALGPGTTLPDPKDKIGAYESLRRALLAKAAGRWDEAVGVLRKVVAESPRMPEAWEALGETLLRQERTREALLALRKALDLDPQRLTTLLSLGGALVAADQPRPALAHYERADALRKARGLEKVPGLHAGLGDCLARLGRLSDAERELRAEVDAFPGSVDARVRLAALYRVLGRPGDARRVLLALEAAAAPDPEAYAAVLGALDDLGEKAAAAEWARRARSRFPADPRFR